MSKDFFYEEEGNLYVNLGEPFGVYSISNILSINTEDLNNAMSEQPELYFKIGVFASTVEHLEKIKKSDRDFIKAQIDNEIRETSQKKLTEAKISNLILLDSRYKEAEKKYLYIKKIASMASVLQKSMEHKKDMLVSLSSNFREEMRSEMSNLMKKFKEV